MRLRSEQGFGLIELLMAMVMLNIGILAIVAAFNCGIVRAQPRQPDLRPPRRSPTPQMELYRALIYDSIDARLDHAGSSVDNTYKCDSALGGLMPELDGEPRFTTTSARGSPIRVQLRAAAVTGADRKNYRIDTYITSSHADRRPGAQVVTVVVRDAKALGTAVRPRLVDVRPVDR